MLSITDCRKILEMDRPEMAQLTDAQVDEILQYLYLLAEIELRNAEKE